MEKKIAILLVCLMLIVTALPVMGTVNLGTNKVSSQTTHYGDLIISGNDVFIIENETFYHTGNIFVYDNAKLIIRNSTLIFEQAYHGEFKFYFYDTASFIVQDASILSHHAYALHFFEQSIGGREC